MRRLLLLLAVVCGSAASDPKPNDAPADKRAALPLDPDPDRLFEKVIQLGKAPAIPAAFGKLRPWMPLKDVDAARPKAWKNEAYRDDGDIHWAYDLEDEHYNRLTELSITFTRADLRHRLVAAWGPPSSRRAADSIRDDTVCWNRAGLLACHRFGSFAGGATDQIELSAWQRLDDTLAASSPAAPEKLATYLGKRRDELRALLPGSFDDPVLSKRNPTLVFPILPSEYSMSWLPDELAIDFTDGKAHHVALTIRSDDETRTKDLRDRIGAVVKRASGSGHTTDLMGA